MISAPPTERRSRSRWSLQERLGALTVPIAAVKQNGQGNDVVRVIDLAHGGRIHEVQVKTGLSEGSYIEIQSGLRRRPGRGGRGRSGVTGMTAVTNGSPLLELTNVSRVYGEQVQVYALRDVSLQINAADLLAIVGPSGSGKSTMLGLLGVLDRPTEGTVEVAGVDTGTLDDAGRSKLRGETIGFVFQQFHLIPHLTALGNVSTALLYRGLSRGRVPRPRHGRARTGGPRAAGRPPSAAAVRR